MGFALADDSEVGWSAWAGGACPAYCGRYVEVKMRDQTLKPMRIKSCDLEWHHQGARDDVVAWRYSKRQ